MCQSTTSKMALGRGLAAHQRYASCGPSPGPCGTLANVMVRTRPRRPAPRPTTRPARVRRALAALSVLVVLSGSVPAPVAAQRAVTEARSTDTAGDLDALIGRALGGESDAEVDAAIDALRDRADARAVPALVSLSRHRRAGARRRAYLALAALRNDVARDAVSGGLSDVDASVRSVCARALGDMDARAALPRLFTALERGVHDAARSIGALAREEDLPRFHVHLGTIPLSAMLEGYARIVRRTDISWDQKRDVLHRLFEVAGLEVRGFLAQWLRELPASAPAALRADLERSIRRIPLRPRARGGAGAGESAGDGATGASTAGGETP